MWNKNKKKQQVLLEELATLVEERLSRIEKQLATSEKQQEKAPVVNDRNSKPDWREVAARGIKKPQRESLPVLRLALLGKDITGRSSQFKFILESASMMSSKSDSEDDITTWAGNVIYALMEKVAYFHQRYEA